MFLAVGLLLLAREAVAAPPRRVPTAAFDVHSPFAGPARRSLRALKSRVHDLFGAPRSSYVARHKHAGVDLRGAPMEWVFAIGPGVVHAIDLDFPHRTVVVRHGDFFSSYKHIEGVGVKIGDEVDSDTRLGRLFSPAEMGRVPWRVTHLHFELRRSYDDGGAASWTSMTLAALEKFCSDPLSRFSPCISRIDRPTRRVIGCAHGDKSDARFVIDFNALSAFRTLYPQGAAC